MGKVLYPKAFNVRVSESVFDRVAKAAARDERSPTSWIRETIRRALEAEDKRRSRAGR